MNNAFCVRTLVAVAGLAVVSSACVAAGAGPVAAGAVTMSLPIRGGGDAFVVADPSAATSAAWRLTGEDGGAAALAEGYTVHSRVIVETGSRAGLEEMLRRRAGLARAAAPAVKATGVRGFSLVETGSVGEAVALAEELRASGAFGSVEVDLERPRVLRGALPNDPLFGNQWHLRNTANPIADVNAEAAWALGYTGLGVTVGVTEGGFQISHPDLAPHYVAAASQGGGSSSHATAVAGVFGAVGDNGVGVSGLAYNCGVSSQLLGSSNQNAAAFTFRNDLNDIKNDSWGPSDNGTLWDQYASSVELAALADCTALGRGGLGTMTCWAAGNGGNSDRVDYDPYTSSRHTFAIGAIGDLDRESSFNERGASMLVVTHTSGNNRGITSTTSGSGYTSSFGGTSSASPLAAGALALALEANPGLTWRDMQALLVETARVCDPGDSYWTTNAAGHDISERFGFGAVDAGALVAAAEVWQNLPEEVSATTGVVSVSQTIPDANSAGVTLTAEIAEDFIVEQVVLTLNVTTTDVGDLRISLTSPEGTVSVFSEPRGFDTSDNISGHNFMSLRSFGESSAGTWAIKIADEAVGATPFWQNYTLTVYGHEGAAGCNAADLAEPYGVLDLADVQAFVSAFVGEEPGADLAAPFGVWDLADVQAFSGAFSAGCP